MLGSFMTTDQIIILVILACTVVLFVWGRWRHDTVALAALIACIFTGIVPGEEAFTGFSHHAVITVACVLVLSKGLQTSGALEALAHRFLPESLGPKATILLLTVLVTIPSAFMNNVGALVLMMPIAIKLAEKHGLPPGRMLMPLSFGSILGGMTTLIGTPPNLIVGAYRAETAGRGFAMFDFAPVGLAVTIAGLIFIVLLGWRLVPKRERSGAGDFATGDYLTEARVPDDSSAVGKSLREVEDILDKDGAQIVGIIRNEVRLTAPNPARLVMAEDILVIEAEPKALTSVLSGLGLKLEEAVPPEGTEDTGDKPMDAAPKDAEEKGEDEETKPVKTPAYASEVVLRELTILPDSMLAGRSAASIGLRTNHGINLLAISRQGRRSTARLRTMLIRPGDVLLVQGSADAIGAFASEFGCVPLAERALSLPDKRQAITAGAIMVAAIGAAAAGLVPAAVALAAGVLATMLFRTVPLRKIYETVDWPLIVLLGALIPVAGAMSSTGAADLVARSLLSTIAGGNAVIALAVILVVTMTLSDFMNNAATAAVMCPIASGTAASLGVAADPFLMAVAVGASCAFLTPIGHKNNLIIMGPSGFQFGDYWKMGLPLEVIVVVVAIPMLLWAWPI
ncbi:MAG: SLC13 family permease [Alphaproteobacteria bacterium]|nr:SLC13 family permease [Alphaproteobacteria bacterium]